MEAWSDGKVLFFLFSCFLFLHPIDAHLGGFFFIESSVADSVALFGLSRSRNHSSLTTLVFFRADMALSPLQKKMG